MAERIETILGNMGYILISRISRYTKKEMAKGKRFFEISDYQEYTTRYLYTSQVSKYNGYKVSGAYGCQITTEATVEVLAEIEKLEVFADVIKKVHFYTAV